MPSLHRVSSGGTFCVQDDSKTAVRVVGEASGKVGGTSTKQAREIRASAGSVLPLTQCGVAWTVPAVTICVHSPI